MAWTDDMINDLKKMWKKGLTTNEIAKELGVSKNSIVGKVHRLNLISRPSPIKKKDEKPKKTTSTCKKTIDKAPKQEPEAKSEVAVSKVQKTPVTKTPVQTEVKSSEPKFHKNTCIQLSDLDSHTCRWPIGDPKDDNFCFCGRHVKAGQTYCEEHSALAYVKPIKKEK